MAGLIEPNLHPLIVHFVIAFLLTSPVFLLLASLSSPTGKFSRSAQVAGDWMLALGILAAFAAVGAGLQAYYTVNHDTPSHLAMTDHRNFGYATLALFSVFALWRFGKRTEAPSKLFSVLFLAATLLLATTAWKGGRLVYHYGLGVASLPAAEGEGHDHEHAPGEEHSSALQDDSSHAHDENSEAIADEGHHEASEPLSNVSLEEYPDTPEGVVNAYAAALRAGDESTVRKLLANNVIIAEGGGAERSIEEYAGHHMPADMKFTAAVEFTLKKRDTHIAEDMATIISESQVHGTFNGAAIHSRMMETMVLRKDSGDWKIVHIHWSSAPITGDHEH